MTSGLGKAGVRFSGSGFSGFGVRVAVGQDLTAQRGVVGPKHIHAPPPKKKKIIKP